jgi:hypothetical protein
MQASAKPKSAEDRRDFVVIPSDQVRVAPSDAEISDLLRAAARQHSEAGVHAAADLNPSAQVPVPAVDTTFRATNVNDNVPTRGQTFGRRLMRAVAALLLAMGIGAAALTWQTFGYAAKKVLITWVPKWAIVASLPLDKLGLGPNSSPSDSPADAAPAQADASAPAATDTGTTANAAATVPAPSPDATERLQSMAHDLASANQEIETLKAGIAELKASQQQMSRDLAKAASDRAAAEQAAKAKAAAAHKLAPPPYSPTTTAAPAYRPSPSAYSAQAAVPQPSPQAAAQPNVPPMQLQRQADPGLPPTALRPPMPVQ